MSPSGFDCSGFTSYIYKQFGVSLNRTAAGQYSNGSAVSRSELQAGDLVMFGQSGINHVGIYMGTMVWKDMYDFSEDSVLLVLASEHYDSEEYIRDYNAFLREVNQCDD